MSRVLENLEKKNREGKYKTKPSWEESRKRSTPMQGVSGGQGGETNALTKGRGVGLGSGACRQVFKGAGPKAVALRITGCATP